MLPWTFGFAERGGDVVAPELSLSAIGMENHVSKALKLFEQSSWKPSLGNPPVLLAESGPDSREKEQFGRFGVGFRLQVTFCSFLLLCGAGGRK